MDKIAYEVKNYLVCCRAYWPLITGIGLLFGWLLSFPLMGPLMYALTGSRSLDPVGYSIYFLIGHILGLIVSALVAHFKKEWLRWFPVAAIPCMLLSLLIPGVGSSIWNLLLVICGFFTGTVVIGWGYRFILSVPNNQRGRTFILGAVAANLILYGFSFAVSHVDYISLLNIASFLPLFVPLLLMIAYRPVDSPKKDEIFRITDSTNSKLLCWRSLLFVFAIYTVGGIAYYVSGHSTVSPPELLKAFWLLPYIVFLFIAGSISDNYGRRINALVGAGCIGAGFMLVGIFQGNAQFAIIQIMITGGYAFLDTFTWVVAADYSKRNKVPLVYSLILAINLSGILAGLLLGSSLLKTAFPEEVMVISIAGILALLSMGVVFKMPETLVANPVLPLASSAAYLALFAQKVGLTPREIDIAILLLNGSSTHTILNKLVITPNTLKSHLRNIYRKAGAHNRLEFTLAVINEAQNLQEKNQNPSENVNSVI